MYNSNSIDIGKIVREIARAEVPKIIRETLNAQTAAPENDDQKPLTVEEIIWFVGRPIWCEYGVFKEWKVLEEIHISNDDGERKFTLTFTDGHDYNFDEMKCYRGKRTE